MTRMPIVAGMFYESSPSACRKAVEELIRKAQPPDDLPARLYGGLVPHAGWICSGAVAATTFKALASRWTGQSVVLLGAVHAHAGPRGMLYARGAWKSPLGETAVDEELAREILRTCPDVREDPDAHANEHSLEVQLPFIQQLWPEARIVPLMVPPSPLATGIGEQLGRTLAGMDSPAMVIGSTDLTHYGPRYGMMPAGVGEKALAWAERNDDRLLAMVASLSAERVVDETYEHFNACGGGAIAAALAACRALGAKQGKVLWHTNSYEVLKGIYQTDLDDAVGYASVVFA